MKRFYILFIISLCAFCSNAQVSSNYFFKAVKGTYTPLTGASIAVFENDGSGASDEKFDEAYVNGISIGFNFLYDGITYTTINANTNGFASFMAFNKVAANTYPHSMPNLRIGSGGIRPILAPLWDDNQMLADRVLYKTSGTSPNQVFTLEWDKVFWDLNAGTNTLTTMSFQIKLFETTNIVEFHYKQEDGSLVGDANDTQEAASIGITGQNFDDFISLNNSSFNPSASTSVNTDDINTKPATGQIYRFIPITTHYWVGNSTNFNDGSNWHQGTVPTTTSNVYVPAKKLNDPVLNMPVLNSSQVVNNLTLEPGTNLSVSNNTLTINGAVTDVGTITANGSSNLIMGGSGEAGTLYFTQSIDGGTNIVNSLTINRGLLDSVYLGNKLIIKDLYNPTGGVLNTGNFLHLQSSATNTARVGAGPGYNYITGKVIVERYIPAKKAWRLLTAPLKGDAGSVINETINGNWQNNFATNGVGTNISGPSGTGFDYTSPGYSMKRFNLTTQLLDGVSNTNDQLFSSSTNAANIPYFIFIAGDKTIFHPSGPNSTTLKAVGELQTGTQTFSYPSLVAGKVIAAGNPYASPVDFDLVSKTNIDNLFWTWDPNLNTYGGYVLVSKTGSSYTTIPHSPNVTGSTSGSTVQNQHIQSGQAFFVRTIATSASTLTFNESNKSSTTINNVFRIRNTTTEELRINLEYVNGNKQVLADGILALFNNDFSSKVDNNDVNKFYNGGENFMLMRNDKDLTLERRPIVNSNDTLYFKFNNLGTKEYRFAIYPKNMRSDLVAFVEDSYLKTKSPISLSTSTSVPFFVDSNPASYTANRFKLILRKAISFTNIEADIKGKRVIVKWSVLNEKGTKNFEIEKSSNGISFTKVATLNAKADNNGPATYTWIDESPSLGENYYKIKAVSINNDVDYSKPVKVHIDKLKGSTREAFREMIVYPNPVAKQLNLQLSGYENGLYNLSLTNSIGIKVLAESFTVFKESTVKTITLPGLSPGIYILQLKKGTSSTTQKIIVK